MRLPWEPVSELKRAAAGAHCHGRRVDGAPCDVVVDLAMRYFEAHAPGGGIVFWRLVLCPAHRDELQRAGFELYRTLHELPLMWRGIGRIPRGVSLN